MSNHETLFSTDTANSVTVTKFIRHGETSKTAGWILRLGEIRGKPLYQGGEQLGLLLTVMGLQANKQFAGKVLAKVMHNKGMMYF